MRESDIGKNRAMCSQSKLAELNTYVPVNVYTDELANDYLKKFEVFIIKILTF